jgi:NAD-dependent SIR2 family protein deacetylase
LRRERKMEEFTCPHCHKTTYTACRDNVEYCPYCDTEKVLVLNPKALHMGYDFSNAKVVVDRRHTEIPVDDDRRKRDEIQLIPIAWFVIKSRVA